MGMINSGSLNRRIQVQRYVETERDRFGGSVGEWHNEGPALPAQRRDVSDAERRIGGGGIGTLLKTRFTVRASTFSKTIRRSDRILHDEVAFDIEGIKEMIGNRAFLEISAYTDDAA